MCALGHLLIGANYLGPVLPMGSPTIRLRRVCLLFIDYIISDVPTFNNRFGGVNRGSLTLWSIFLLSRLLPWSNTIIWPLYLHCGCSAVFGQGEEQPDQHSPNAFPYNIALGFLIYRNIKNPRGNIPL